MDDVISRQEAIDELKRISFSHYFECGEYLSEDTREIKIISSSKALEVIEALPPAQPAPQNDSDRIYAMMKDYYFEHKDEHDVSWQGGFGKCMNLIPNVIEKKAQPEPLVKESRTLVKDLVEEIGSWNRRAGEEE